MPRTTAHRVLETLVAEGYAEKIPYQHGYRLTPAICHLARGFSDESWVAHVASPILFAETKRTRWPLFIATRSGEFMEVRVSTDRESPHAIDHYRCGHRVPAMFCASGHVILAFSAPPERDEILDLLRKSEHPDQRPAREDAYVQALLSRTRSAGYANVSYEGYSEAGLGVPIFIDGRVRACLLMLYLRAAVSEMQVATELAPALVSVAKEIQGRAERLKHGMPNGENA
jgi:IclR family mhp operon transcriptional activator